MPGTNAGRGIKKARRPRTSLLLAGWVLVFTTLAPAVLTAQTIMALYRCRWQVEIAIKRWKSVLDVDALRAKATSPLAEVWLHGKLLYALMLERRMRRQLGDSWGRLDRQRVGTWWRVWGMLKDEIGPMITGALFWKEDAWAACLKVLVERPRRRKLQRLPPEALDVFYRCDAANKRVCQLQPNGILSRGTHGILAQMGLTPAGQWVAVRHGFLLPARVVMAVFRGKMVAAIRQTLARGALALPEPMRPQQVLNLLNRLGHPTKTKWNVRIMERYRHGAGVVTYLARYLRGGPIKNGRLVAYDGDCVTFTYRARQEEADAGSASPQQMTLPVADFLQRWLLHVPVPQTRVVRSYGLYHPSHAAALAVCRAELGQPPLEAPAALDWQTVCAQRGEAHPERCPTCGQLLVCTGVIPRGGAPPRLASEKCAA